MSTPSQLPWILSQWHAISSSAAPITMDGVLFQDIKSIIDAMQNSHEVTVWSDHLTTLYNHLSDYNNPHEVTIDQLPISVIEYLYQKWRKEGYIGDLQFFIDLIFTYIKIIQFAELMSGENIDSEILAPSVAAVTAYIKQHNESLTAHDPIFSTVYAGDHHYTWPTAAYFKHLSPVMDLEEYLVPDMGLCFNIPAFGDPGYSSQENTVVGCSKFKNVNQIQYGINRNGAAIAYGVRYSWNTRSIQLVARQLDDGAFHGFDEHTGMTPYNEKSFITEQLYSEGGLDKTILEIDLRDYLPLLDDPDYCIASALVISRHRLKLAIRIQNVEHSIDKLIIRIANQEIPNKVKRPAQPRLFTLPFTDDTPIMSLTTYREAMSNLQLLSLLDGHQFPIVKTA